MANFTKRLYENFVGLWKATLNDGTKYYSGKIEIPPIPEGGARGTVQIYFHTPTGDGDKHPAVNFKVAWDHKQDEQKTENNQNSNGGDELPF